MTHWRTLVSNSETLSAIDLGDKTATATISGIEGGAFEAEETDKRTGETRRKLDKKALISFEGRDKKLAANVTNCELLEAMFGPDYEGWVGHRVTMKADKVESGGKKGEPCVRICGSPELSEPLTVSVQLRGPGGTLRRPFTKTLVPTRARSQSGQEANPQAASGAQEGTSSATDGDGATPTLGLGEES
jgi:hypothetical protein